MEKIHFYHSDNVIDFKSFDTIKKNLKNNEYLGF